MSSPATLVTRSVIEPTHDVWLIVTTGAPSNGVTGPTLPGTTGVDYGIGSLAIQLDGAAGSQLWQKTAAGNAGWMLFETGLSQA